MNWGRRWPRSSSWKSWRGKASGKTCKIRAEGALAHPSLSEWLVAYDFLKRSSRKSLASENKVQGSILDSARKKNAMEHVQIGPKSFCHCSRPSNPNSDQQTWQPLVASSRSLLFGEEGSSGVTSCPISHFRLLKAFVASFLSLLNWAGNSSSAIFLLPPPESQYLRFASRFVPHCPHHPFILNRVQAAESSKFGSPNLPPKQCFIPTKLFYIFSTSSTLNYFLIFLAVACFPSSVGTLYNISSILQQPFSYICFFDPELPSFHQTSFFFHSMHYHNSMHRYGIV